MVSPSQTRSLHCYLWHRTHATHVRKNYKNWSVGPILNINVVICFSTNIIALFLHFFIFSFTFRQ